MNSNNLHKHRLSSADFNNGSGPPTYTAAQRNTLGGGLRLLAKMIARAHLRRQPEGSAAAPGPPPPTPHDLEIPGNGGPE